MDSVLAINGGKPIRETLLRTDFPGASLYGEEEKQAVMEVIERRSPFRYYGFDVAGKTPAFERYFKEKIGAKHALGVTSGTASLVVALKAIGIGPGDKVIVPANTFLASAGAVVIAGGVPIFADVDDSMNIDPAEIERLCDSYTKAVLPVPILGNPCEMDRIMEIARKRNIAVIEDVAQSCGSKYKGKYSGTYGDIGCFSLQMNKLLTTGDGGAVVTDNDMLYERAVRYHDQGMFREREGFLSSDTESDIFIGQNYRMSEVTGALALEQIKKMDYIVTRLRDIKQTIKEQIKDIDGLSFRRIVDPEGDNGVCLFMMLPNEDLSIRFSQALFAENITCGRLYSGRPVYELPQIFNQRTVEASSFPFDQFDEKIEYSMGMCPYVEEHLPRNAVITLSPVLTKRDVEDIVRAIRKVAKSILGG